MKHINRFNEQFEEEVESPCIGVCRLEGGYCAGCKRTGEEIGNWWNYSNDEKAEIVKELKRRKEQKKRRPW
jgi:predicted Fe-S protein YdhL (DUF1289 family)